MGRLGRLNLIQKLKLPRMMSEKTPLLMVLATLLYLASSVHGGIECLRREGPVRHEDCVSLVTVSAQELLQGPSGCNATHCYDSKGYTLISYCCGEKFEQPIVEGQGSAKTTCTCKQMHKNNHFVGKQ